MNLSDQVDRDVALTVPCPHCHAAATQECVRGDGEPLTSAAAHTPRLRAAGVVHAPLDARELDAIGRRDRW